jgi:glycosyltransferase involved in cell wall biosynthesis
VLFDLTVLETSSRVRGIGRYIIELARALGRRDDEDLRFRFVETLEPYGRSRMHDEPGPALERLLDPRREEIRHVVWNRRVRRYMPRAASRSGAALLHMPFVRDVPRVRAGIRRVVTCYDLIPLLYPQHYLDWTDGYLWGKRWKERRRYAAADHVMAISQASADDLQRVLGVPRQKVSVVHIGIDGSRWSPEARDDDGERVAALGLEPGRFLLYVGDADWRKNHEGMLRAQAQVPADQGGVLA